VGKINDTLAGVKILFEGKSKYNGKLKVTRDLAWGTYIMAGGLTQSGGIAKLVWKRSLAEVKKQVGFKITSCLILGLGAGGNAQVVRKLWPDASITGVEIDPLMIKLGKKYLNLEKLELEIKISDAMEFIDDVIKKKQNYDLILVDMYHGSAVPKKFESQKFFEKLKKLLTKDGKVVVNRLYYKEKKQLAEKTFSVLKRVFKKFTLVMPEANIMFVCYD
jgi:spermidine synthase